MGFFSISVTTYCADLYLSGNQNKSDSGYTLKLETSNFIKAQNIKQNDTMVIMMFVRSKTSHKGVHDMIVPSPHGFTHVNKRAK